MGTNVGQEAKWGRLLRRSTTVSLFTGLGVAAGFAVDVLVVARFGIGAETDAFFAAYTLPFILVTSLAAVQPVLVSVLAGHRDDESAFSALLNAAGLLALLATGLGVWLARPLVTLTAPGFDAAAAARAAALSQILFLRVPAAALSEVARAELYTRRRFALATFSNALPSLAAAGLLVAAGPGAGIRLVAWGLFAGSLAQAALLGGALFGPLQVRYQPHLRRRAPFLRRTGGLVLAPLAGVLLRQGVTLAERAIGSFLPAGSVTALSYANRLTMVAAGLLFDGLNTAALPSLAEGWNRGERRAARADGLTLLKLATTVALPAGLALAALSRPLARLFFQRGQVDAQAALLLGTVWGVYALSLPFLGPYRVVQTAFYAMQSARPVVVLHAVLAGLTVGLDLFLVRSLGAAGLALAFVLGCGLASALGLAWLKRQADAPLRGRGDAWRWAWPLALTSAAMAMALFGVSRWLEPLLAAAGAWGLLLTLAASGLAGLAVFAGLGTLLRLEAVTAVWRLARR